MDFPLEKIFMTIFSFLTFVDMEKAGEKEIQWFWFGGTFFVLLFISHVVQWKEWWTSSMNGLGEKRET